MKKELFIVEVKNNNQDVLYDWIDRNRDQLTYVSEEKGCGCCVSIFEIEGDEEILTTFPRKILE